MPIISTKLISETLQSDGRRLVLYEFTDHLGMARLGSSKLMAEDFDRVEDAAFETDRHTRALVKMEEAQALDSDDVMAFINNPQHGTKRGMVRRIIRHIARENDPQELRRLGAFIQYVQTNFTSAEARRYLNVTGSQLGRLNRKMTALLSAETNLKEILRSSEVIK